MENRKTIELTRTINGPRSIVFNAIRSGALFRSTGIKEDSFAHDFRVGGLYSLEWNSGGQCAGRYLQIVADKKVSFTWNSTCCNGGTNRDTTVTVSLADRGNSCELTLTHEDLEAGFSYDDHLKGWTSSLDDLSADLIKPNSTSSAPQQTYAQ